MNFIDSVAALVILGLFFFTSSQAFLPAYRAWEKAADAHNNVQSIRFVAESFKNECAKTDRNIENWKKTVSSVKELEYCEISELRQAGKLKALKAVCVIGGEQIEILALCAP